MQMVGLRKLMIAGLRRKSSRRRGMVVAAFCGLAVMTVSDVPPASGAGKIPLGQTVT